MKPVLLVAVAGAALVGLPANAAVVNISVTGVVGFGLDNMGLFGPAGASLRNAAYRMDYAYDISNALDGGNTRQANGGTLFNRPSPIRRADLTINGATLSVIDPYSATYARFLFPTSSQLDFGTGGPNGINGGSLSWSRSDQGIALALDSPINRAFDSTDTVFSSFQRANAQLTVFTYLSLRPANITIAVAGQGVPEPASWAMMIAGFALAGSAARRSRRKVLAIAA